MNRTLLISTILFSSFTFAEESIIGDPILGEEIYNTTEFSRVMNGEERDDVQCSTCHDPQFYTRADRKADSYQRLHFWVNSCNDMLGAGWFPEDVSDVTSYLNKLYYEYDVKK